ncbi:MAG: T9SS type A sorting domain-containing protein [Bacteroidetes bacterium]|nr:T9SS type A sorting domain-containing protein [Bacteroidota bacterium]
MKKIILFIVMLTMTIYVCGQSKKVMQWQFPTNCGLDFNGGQTVAITTGQITTTEGSSSMADDNGDLLFYTDGIKVWDKNHNTMPNGTGLLGNSSSSQAALIVQQPGSATNYYVFTTDEQAGPDGFAYSIVDITLNGGLGDVTSKNNLLISPICEKVTGCRHANGSDFWIVTHEYGNDKFYSYLLTAAGLVTTPVITAVGSANGGTNTNSIGYMKISPNGKKLASAVSRDDLFEVFDFDNATGIPSNPLSIVVGDWTYGVEFSPNSNVLYGTLFTGPIYQYDLTAGSNAAILASEYLVAISASPELGAVQLAPNGKIYAARKQLSWLGVINDPNQLGAACNYVDNGLSLLPYTCYYGLPNMLPSYLNTFGFIHTCFGDTTLFSISDSAAYAVCSWDFDDPNSGPLNSSNYFSVGHVFTAPGNYNVQIVLINQALNIDTIYLPITIDTLPVVTLPNDTILCNGSNYQLSAAAQGATSFLWNNGSTGSSLNVSSPGTYTCTVRNNSCEATDSIVILYQPCAIPNVNFSCNDTSWCEKQAIDYFDISTNIPTSWLWTFSGANPATSTDQNPTGIFYPSYGSFDVKLIACNAAGCDSLTLTNFVTEHQNPPAPVITTSNDTLYCSPAISYQWFNTINLTQVLSTDSFYFPLVYGSYFVLIYDSNGCSSPSPTIVFSSIESHQFANYFLNCNYSSQQSDLLMINTNLKNATVTIYDELGRVVVMEEKMQNGNSDFNIGSLSNSIYLVQVRAEEIFLSRKIVIAR